MWLHWIGRAKFKPKNHDRVCSKHFIGGKKTCLHNVPTLVEKVLLPTQAKPRTTHKCRNRKSPPKKVKPMSQDDKISQLEKIVENLKQANEKQQGDVAMLNKKVQECSFSIWQFKSNDSDFEFYTGFCDYGTFQAFYNYLCPACENLQYIGSGNSNSVNNKEKCGPKRLLSPEEELFLYLVRFRWGLLERDIAHRFNISQSHVSPVWVTWLYFLYRQLRSIPIWPSKEFVQATMPESFKNSYPHTRVIIDCTELFIETPSQPRSQSATFSTYKNHNTGKGLIGISPRGDLTFVSELYAGNTSDIMADRGFEIEEDLPPGVLLNIPPFLGDQPQFSEEDEIKTRRIAKHRIHVERAIQRIKSFRILKHDLPISMAADLNKIWVTCSYLTLFFRPLIREHEE